MTAHIVGRGAARENTPLTDWDYGGLLDAPNVLVI